MTADDYNDLESEDYESEDDDNFESEDDENYKSEDDDSSLWDLTGIYHTEDEVVPVILPEDVTEDRRGRNRDRRSGVFSDRRRGDDRRHLSRSALQNGKQSADPMSIYLREMGSLIASQSQGGVETCPDAGRGAPPHTKRRALHPTCYAGSP